MADALDEIDAVEVGGNLAEVVDHTGQTVQRRRATQVLQVPEEKGEDQTNAEAHEPGDKEERQTPLVVHWSQHTHPVGHFSSSLCIDGALQKK